MNIEMLRKMSADRLAKIGIKAEKHQNALKFEELKKRKDLLEQEISQFEANATYENDFFSAIDKRKILIEDIERELEYYDHEEYEMILGDRPFYGNFDQYKEFIEITGIIELLFDPNYIEVLRDNADALGIPQLKDVSFLKQLQDSNVLKDDIDYRILCVPFMADNKYDSKIIINFITEYIRRLVELSTIMSMNKYLELNKTYHKALDSYAAENLYEGVSERYDEKLKIDVLKSFASDEIYDTVNPGYAMNMMHINSNVLLKKDGQSTVLEEPKKIFANVMILHNDEDVSTNWTLSDFTELDTHKLELLEFMVDDELANGLTITDEEVNSIIGSGMKK